MSLPRRKYFGWYDGGRGAYHLSLLPPDAPVRPAVRFADSDGYAAEDILAAYVKRKRIDVVWLPPLALARESAVSDAIARARKQ